MQSFAVLKCRMTASAQKSRPFRLLPVRQAVRTSVSVIQQLSQDKLTSRRDECSRSL